MGANFLRRRGVLLLSAACLALTILSYLLSHRLNADTALVRCFMSLSAIGATTFLALKNQSANMVMRERARLLDLTHDTVFVRDMNDVITYWNRGAEELYGWRRDEAIGQVSHQLMKTVFPAPLEEITAGLFRTGRWEGELVHTKRDGTRRDRGEPMVFAAGRARAAGRNDGDQQRRHGTQAGRRRAARERAQISEHFPDCRGIDLGGGFFPGQSAIDDLKAQGVRDFGHYFIDSSGICPASHHNGAGRQRQRSDA